MTRDELAEALKGAPPGIVEALRNASLVSGRSLASVLTDAHCEVTEEEPGNEGEDEVVVTIHFPAPAVRKKEPVDLPLSGSGAWLSRAIRRVAGWIEDTPKEDS